MEREKFVFHKSWADAIKDLPKDIKLEVYEAIIEYGLTGTERDLKPMVKLAFGFVKTNIDKDRQISEARSFAGKKGGGNPNFKKGQKNPYYDEKDKQKINKNKQNKTKINRDKLIYNDYLHNHKSYLHNSNKYLFVQITDLADTLKNWEGDKGCLFIAYRFWELWHKHSPADKTLNNADAIVWANEVRKILNNDKTSIERLIAIYSYFHECANEKAGFNAFWFKTIKSIAGIRKKNKDGEYYIDRIIDEINSQIAKNTEFEEFVFSNIEKFKSYATKP